MIGIIFQIQNLLHYIFFTAFFTFADFFAAMVFVIDFFT